MTEAYNRRSFPSHRGAQVDIVGNHTGGTERYFAVDAPPLPTSGGDRSLAAAVRQLWRRRWFLFAAMLAGGSIAAAVVWSLPSFYVGEARLLVGVAGPRVLNVEAVIADISPDAERVQNESFILQSRTIASEVVAQLQLDKDPAFNPQLRGPSMWSRLAAAVGEALAPVEARMPPWMLDWVATIRPAPLRAPPPGSEQKANQLVDLLLSRIDVANLGRSHVLSIKAEAPSPTTAAAIANSFAEKYLDFQRGEKVRTIERVDKFLADKIGELRDQVRKSDQAVEDYRRTHGLYKSGQGSVTTQQLSELNSQLMAAQAAKVDADSRLAEAQFRRLDAATSETVPAVLHSPLIAALKQQQAESERRAAEASVILGDRHPQARSVRAEAGSIASRLSAEVSRIVEGLTREARAANARHAALAQQFERLKKEIGTVNDKSIQLEALEREAVVDRNLLEAMLNRAKQSAGSADFMQANAKLVSAAVPAELPSYPPKALIIFLGSLAAALAAAAIAWIRETNDHTLRRPEEVEALTGLPLLAMVPQLRRKTVAQKVLREPNSPYGEALRRLFLGVELSDVASSPKVMLFSSSIPGEGKSVMVSSLGRMLAKDGKRVLMVDCDWRNPQLHQILRCSSGPGLAELLTDDAALLNASLHRDKQSGADVIPAGSWDSRAAHLLRSERMAELLALLASSYDVILLDCPPVLVTADALALSRLAQKVVYVARWGHTPHEAILEGLKQFHAVQADLAGVAVSRVDVKEYRRYSYRNLTYNYARASVATVR
jgi:polysaccharide biosynthesis transport protein